MTITMYVRLFSQRLFAHFFAGFAYEDQLDGEYYWTMRGQNTKHKNHNLYHCDRFPVNCRIIFRRHHAVNAFKLLKNLLIAAEFIRKNISEIGRYSMTKQTVSMVIFPLVLHCLLLKIIIYIFAPWTSTWEPIVSSQQCPLLFLAKFSSQKIVHSDFFAQLNRSVHDENCSAVDILPSRGRITRVVCKG